MFIIDEFLLVEKFLVSFGPGIGKDRFNRLCQKLASDCRRLITGIQYHHFRLEISELFVQCRKRLAVMVIAWVDRILQHICILITGRLDIVGEHLLVLTLMEQT